MAADTDELVLTYAELGDRLGIRPAGARAWAKRRAATGRVRIVEPNGPGPSRVYLHPNELADRSASRSPDRPGDLALNLAVAIGERDLARMETVAVRAEAAAILARIEAERDVARADGAAALARVEAERDAARVERDAALARLNKPWWRAWRR